MDTFQSRLASIIKNRRQEMKISQEHLADLIGKTPGFVGQVERQESLPSLETLSSIIKHLGIDANEIFTDGSVAQNDCSEICAMMQQMNGNKRKLLLEIARLLLKNDI